jgi:DNA mismatch endonuclease (patch repair protein)
MNNNLTPIKRSWNMSRIRSKDTGPERVVRSILHHMGYRFSLHREDLPGKPDIVLPKYRTVVFVHGCFWHRHRGCRLAYTPKSRQVFWLKKFSDNVARDRKVQRDLRRLGWQLLVVWECQLEGRRDVIEVRLHCALQSKARR